MPQKPHNPFPQPIEEVEIDEKLQADLTNPDNLVMLQVAFVPGFGMRIWWNSSLVQACKNTYTPEAYAAFKVALVNSLTLFVQELPVKPN